MEDLVDNTLFLRYERLLFQSSLVIMTDIVYCPRPACGSACIAEDNMASCSECYYVFCTICMRLYHGVAPCKDEAGLFKTLSCKYIFPTFNYTNLINYIVY